jgi:hypothetical protein
MTLDTRDVVPDLAPLEETITGPFSLTHAEKHSALWVKLTAHYTARLALLRAKNDGNLTPDETSKLRGRILECKVLLGLADASPNEVAQD